MLDVRFISTLILGVGFLFSHPVSNKIAPQQATPQASKTFLKTNFIIPASFPTSRRAGDWPFASTSPWNIPLATAASITFSASTSPCARDLADPAYYIGLNSTEWSMPVYKAASTDPNVQLRRRSDNSLITTIKVPTSAQPGLPSYGSGGDAHLLIIDPSRRYVDEMYAAERSGSNTIIVAGVDRNDIKGSGIETRGARAYGGSALGGLIRRGEFRNGIFHALAFALPRAKQKCCDPTWIATEVDDGASGSYRGNVPMGQLIAIPSTVDLESLGLSAEGLAVAQALQTYGAYDVDSSGGFSFYMETNAAVAEGFSSDGKDLHEDLVKIRPLLRCVTNNRRDNVGGGGPGASRLAPFAPPFN